MQSLTEEKRLQAMRLNSDWLAKICNCVRGKRPKDYPVEQIPNEIWLAVLSKEADIAAAEDPKGYAWVTCLNKMHDVFAKWRKRPLVVFEDVNQLVDSRAAYSSDFKESFLNAINSSRKFDPVKLIVLQAFEEEGAVERSQLLESLRARSSKPTAYRILGSLKKTASLKTLAAEYMYRHMQQIDSRQ